MFTVDGITVEFFHIRPNKVDGDMRTIRRGELVIAREYYSAITDCEIYDETDDTVFSTGSAYCLHGDNFDKAFGRKLALTRALQNSELEKELRTKIWNKYWEMVKR